MSSITSQSVSSIYTFSAEPVLSPNHARSQLDSVIVCCYRHLKHGHTLYISALNKGNITLYGSAAKVAGTIIKDGCENHLPVLVAARIANFFNQSEYVAEAVITTDITDNICQGYQIETKALEELIF